LSLIEVAVHASHKVLKGVDDKSALIVGSLQGVLGQQLGPQMLKIVIIM
jgi:hypothetical protein